MPDNPYKHWQPRSMSGGIRKMQAKEIRALQLEWDQQDRARQQELREQAAQVLAEFNHRLATSKPLLFSPLLRAALVSENYWMHVHCPGCSTIKAVDLRVVPRPQETALTAIAAKLSCEACHGQASAPGIVKLTASHTG